MLLPIILTAIFLCFSYRAKKKGYNCDFGECVILSFMGIPLGLLLALLVGLFLPTDWSETETAKLVSLRDGGNVTTGSFFLGTGSIESEQYYFFYRSVGEGYVVDKIRASETVIFEQKRYNGELKSYNKEFVKPWYWLLGIIRSGKKYEVLIPEGSLKKKFFIE